MRIKRAQPRAPADLGPIGGNNRPDVFEDPDVPPICDHVAAGQQQNVPSLEIEAVPSSQATVSPKIGVDGTVVEAGIAFHSGRASMVSTVSKVCGLSSGPGMLCTCKPDVSVTISGVFGAAAPGS